LFLKLLSGAILTIAISASAMLGCASGCFRKNTTDLLQGRRLYHMNISFIFGMPNARMSRYACFQYFQLMPRLDKRVSGIPNAITSQPAAAGMLRRTRSRVCRYREHDCVRAGTSSLGRRDAANQEHVKEEADA
jgi:hypothetical protein